MSKAGRKLARKKSKRMLSVAGQKDVVKLPYGPCFMNVEWREEGESRSLVSVVVTRLLLDGRILASLVLVDRTCLGIKNAYKPEIYTVDQLSDRLVILDDVHRMEQVESAEALSVIHHAVAYAKNLGFDPHGDFRSEIFEPRPAPLLDTPHANDAKPYYFSGPDDNVEYILRQLDERLGRDNYEYMLEMGGL